MRTIVLAALLAVPVATAEEPDTVRALRYRVLVADSALDLTHGGGRWIDEIYFPEQGVVANVTREVDPDAKELAWRWRMQAFPGAIRNRFAERLGGEEKNHPTREIAVPRAVAERIFDLADQTRRQRELSLRAAEHAREAGLFSGP